MRRKQFADLQDKLGELQQSLLELDVVLDIQLNPNLHDNARSGWIMAGSSKSGGAWIFISDHEVGSVALMI